MAKLVSIHSFRGGTGKSNLTANLAANLALEGQRVAVIDTDIQSPGIHVLFDLAPERMHHTLNQFFWGQCAIEDCLHDVSGAVSGLPAGATLQLVPGSMDAGDIARILQEGYSVATLNDGIQRLMMNLDLDFLLIDTHPGVNEETLLSIAISDYLLIAVRPDQQDFQGTAVTVELARQLEVPSLQMVISKALPAMDYAKLEAKVSGIFQAPVAAILPHADEMVMLGSGGLYSLVYPDHDYAAGIRRIVRHLHPVAAPDAVTN